MKKIDRRIVVAFILLFTIGLAFGLMKYLISLKEEPVKRPQPEVTRYVEADTVMYGEVHSPVVARGRAASTAHLDIVSEASGRIITAGIPLKVGSRFKQGDLLFTIYPDEADLALKARKSQFLTLLINLIPDIRLDYPEAEAEYLAFYSRIKLDQDLPDLPDFGHPALNNFLASRTVLSEYYNIKRDELSLKRRSIYAPFDGTYSAVYLEAGGYINTGGRVAHAIRTDELEIEIPLERFHSEFVQMNDPVTVLSPERQLSWKGQVIRKAQFVDPGTQSQSVFVRITHNGNNPVLTGEYLTAQFDLQPVQNVMEIKRNAVFNSNEVFLIVDGHLEKAEIEIVKVNEQTLLFRGIPEGSLVVNQPLINVMEGTPVAVLGSQPSQSQQSGKGKQQEAAQ